MVEIDTTKPHPARMYDWYLGGKDNYPVDEAMGRQMLTLDARVPVMARVNRAFIVTPSWIPRPSGRGGNEAPAEQGRERRIASRAIRSLRPSADSSCLHRI